MWNVEGLTEEQVIQLQNTMRELGISVLAMQETHVNEAPHYIIEEGFLMILSGSGAKGEWAGVGSMVAPWARSCIIGFCQASARMASLRVKIEGGSVAIISAYAPHGGHSLGA